ncbi:uncharacterized protein LOC141632573 [Silene latifolia]|uniref:uncharacterized protein LOC141632573 n=1 Tax=Silene latifolia TaxID=37657 RepID=UPI003D776644
MRKPELSERMVKWSVHLSGYDLKFEPRTAIKSQALADFVSDFSPALQEQADSEILTLSEAKWEPVWELYIDGASNTKGAGVGLVLKSPQGEQIIQAVRCEFKATNSEAEYKALILGLQLALELQISRIEVYSDSQLIVNHVNNVYTSRDPKMIAYLEVEKELKLLFASFNIQQIPRDQNVEADALAILGVAFTPRAVGTIPFIHVKKPAIRQNEQQNASKAATTQWTYEAGILYTATTHEEFDDWRKPYISWLRNEVLAPDQKDTRSFKMKSSRFVLIDGGRSLSNKTLRQGYFWPTMRKDAIVYVKKCEECPRQASVSHQPAEHMHPIISPWPFMKWGMDIMGPLPRASGNRTYMLAMTDYFSKWIEAEAFPQILTNDYCARWNIKLFKSTHRNPQYNGQAESSNKIVMNNLKRRLEEIGAKWADELSFVLWSDRTTPKVATGQTPFSLVYVT